MIGRGQSILKIVGSIIHGKMCYLLLTKINKIFFVRPGKFFEDHFSYTFFIFEAFRYS